MNTTKITKTTIIAIFAIAAIGMIVSSAAIAKPALAKSNSVSKSDLRDVGKFLKCIASHGGNDISKKQAHRCVDKNLG